MSKKKEERQLQIRQILEEKEKIKEVFTSMQWHRRGWLGVIL